MSHDLTSEDLAAIERARHMPIAFRAGSDGLMPRRAMSITHRQLAHLMWVRRWQSKKKHSLSAPPAVQ